MSKLSRWPILAIPVLFLLLAGTLVVVLMLPRDAGGLDQSGFVFGSLRIRLETGIAWAFAAIAALVRWYDVPVHPLHRGIILGFVLHLAVFSTLIQLLASHGYQWASELVTLSPAVLMGVCALWMWSSWRPDAELSADPALVLRLQPWRARGW